MKIGNNYYLVLEKRKYLNILNVKKTDIYMKTVVLVLIDEKRNSFKVVHTENQCLVKR